MIRITADHFLIIMFLCLSNYCMSQYVYFIQLYALFALICYFQIYAFHKCYILYIFYVYYLWSTNNIIRTSTCVPYYWLLSSSRGNSDDWWTGTSSTDQPDLVSSLPMWQYTYGRKSGCHHLNLFNILTKPRFDQNQSSNGCPSSYHLSEASATEISLSRPGNAGRINPDHAKSSNIII